MGQHRRSAHWAPISRRIGAATLAIALASASPALASVSPAPATDINLAANRPLGSPPPGNQPPGDPSPAEISAADAAPMSVWERSVYKTICYEIMANSTDFVIMGMLTGGIASLGATFMGVNVATAATAYFSHEIAWSFLGPPPEAQTAWTTGAKAVTYRVVSVGRSYSVAYLFAGSSNVATIFAIAGNMADTLIYLANEWAWNRYAPIVASTALPDGRLAGPSAALGG